MEFWYFRVVPKYGIWTVSPFQRIYNQSGCCDLVLHVGLKTGQTLNNSIKNNINTTKILFPRGVSYCAQTTSVNIKVASLFYVEVWVVI